MQDRDNHRLNFIPPRSETRIQDVLIDEQVVWGLHGGLSQLEDPQQYVKGFQEGYPKAEAANPVGLPSQDRTVTYHLSPSWVLWSWFFVGEDPLVHVGCCISGLGVYQGRRPVQEAYVRSFGKVPSVSRQTFDGSLPRYSSWEELGKRVILVDEQLQWDEAPRDRQRVMENDLLTSREILDLNEDATSNSTEPIQEVVSQTATLKMATGITETKNPQQQPPGERRKRHTLIMMQTRPHRSSRIATAL